MTWTAAADAVMPAYAHAAAACPPTAVARQRGPGRASPRRRAHLLRADVATPGWPSDPRKGRPLTSSIVLRGEDFSRDPWSPHPSALPAAMSAVRGAGRPVAFPRRHGTTRRGFVRCRADARLTLANDPTVSCCTDISEEVKRRFLPDLKGGFCTPLSG